MGRSFLRYDESPTTAQTKMDAKQIYAAHELLAKLRSADEKLCFKRSTFRDTIMALLQDYADDNKWALKEGDTDGYIKAMTSRMVNLCYCVKQGEQRHPNCGWVKALPWNRGSSPSLPSARKKEEDKDNNYIFGYDRKLGQAWRMRVSDTGAKSAKEFAKNILDKLGKCFATWGGNDEWEVVGLKQEELTRKGRTGGSSRSPSVFWQGEHSVTKNALVVRHRRDRHPDGLVIVTEQGKQVMQVLVRDFQGNMAGAAEFAIGVAKDYAANKFGKYMLKAECKRRFFVDGRVKMVGSKATWAHSTSRATQFRHFPKYVRHGSGGMPWN